ncbi:MULTISPECIES: DUF5993 family protein [Microbulbifer]|uniref:DUF5993 family protein n=1 Tax=Microbulbifer TaxID=48073 RepID=UPI001E63BCA4|nr:MULTISPECIES: DUF5993 family protein [Microbulbifer]UHQ53897.1 DUF5993 family protein [Microbulbifer sp. YPW16]
MVMMLPFVTVLLSAWFAWRGSRAGAVGWWLATLAIFVAWCFYHMTSHLDISL